MSFSVLMSLYEKERPEFLRQSLDSVFNQTLPPNDPPRTGVTDGCKPRC